ncbi:MAG: nitrous oxide-stimulated promoter family protein [Thermoanaerobaculia bacterium]
MKNLKEKRILKDISVLANFTSAYCRENHKDFEKKILNLKGPLGKFLNEYSLKLCKNCEKTLLHGCAKRILCPYDPKPQCKNCPTPCYRNGYREKMREIMRFSGLYFIKKGKISYIFKYMF